VRGTEAGLRPVRGVALAGKAKKRRRREREQAASAAAAAVGEPIEVVDAVEVPEPPAEFVRGLRGARLSYGAAVHVGDRAVIPVARVRAAGRPGAQAVGSAPVGFIEITQDGAYFRPIESASRRTVVLRTGATAAAAALGAFAALRGRRRRWRP
jgi:hypothetical protein